MKNVALFALGFLSVSFWLHDSARCQTSLAPPLSLAPPPTAPDDVSSTAVIGRLPASPRPAADYDGFSIDIVDDGETSNQTTRRVRPRPAKQSKLSQEPDSIVGQQSVDQAEDEKLKRKLTICRGCK